VTGTREGCPPAQLRLQPARRRRRRPTAKALRTDATFEITNLADQNHRELVAGLKRTLLQGMQQIEDPAIPDVAATTKP